MSRRLPRGASVSSWVDVSRRFVVQLALVKVEEGTLTTADGYVHDGGAFRVTDRTTGKVARFYGETAWSDAERLAGDIVWAAR